jgi:2-methylcitrate dehydratase PrpD
METLASRLAARIAELARTPLAPAVRARALALLGDHLGVVLGGASDESTQVLRTGLRALGATGDGTVVGTRERLPPAEAAIANGAAAHALEMDDTHCGGSIHLGSSVFPAALAAAELTPASGETVLRAAVAGYEVGARLAMALGPAAHYRRGFHPTGTCGAFAAAIAAGVVFGLGAPALARALGIAGSQASGSMEFLTDGAWTKRLHPGWAASAGLHAAALARAGFRAPATILEGRAGFLAGYSDDADPGVIAADGELELLRTSIKPHACCRYMQGPIDVALALRATHDLRPERVARVEVGMLGAALAIVCEPAAAKQRPQNVVDAQFSLPFGIAVALARGVASPDEFTPATLGDPAVTALMDRVVAVHDPALDAQYPRAWPAWVRVTGTDGRTVDGRITHPLGDPENFPSADALATKLRTLAARALDPAAIDRLVHTLNTFPAAPDARTLLAATVPPVN